MHAPVIEVHAFEMDRCSQLLLADAVSRAGVAGVTVHHAAMTNQTGLAYTQECSRPGNEGNTILMHPGAFNVGVGGGRWEVSVNAWTLDDFAAKHALGAIDWLVVDTEGSDALVLEGASVLLRERRVTILEFEFNRMGFWAPNSEAPRSLTRSLDVLGAAGYSCFWQGAMAVARASGPCATSMISGLQPVSKRRWSNLVCSWQPQIVAALDAHAVSQGGE